jgi:hypothetical protein
MTRAWEELTTTKEGLVAVVEDARFQGWIQGMTDAAEYLDKRERREMARRLRALIKQKIKDRAKP